MMPIPVWLDTDIGDDVDDAYCLVLAALWPRIQLVGVSTVHGGALSRAYLASKLLALCGRRDVPVFPGNMREGESPQIDWALDRNYSPPGKLAAEAICEAANKYAGKLVLVTIGALTNAAEAFRRDPALADKLARVIIMGGWVNWGGPFPPKHPEYNIACDPPAARQVFQSAKNITMVGLDVTMQARLEKPWLDKIAAAGKPWTDALVELTRRWGHRVPVLHDPLAFSMIADNFCRLEPRRIEVLDDGHTKPVDGQPNCQVAVEVRASEFLDWYVQTVIQAQ